MRDGKKYEEVNEEIDEWTSDEDKLKPLSREQFELMVDKWLADFKIE